MSEEGEMIDLMVETVRRFVDKELIPNEQRLESEDGIPAEIQARMAELGLFGMALPAAYGGLGLSLLDEVRIVFELCRASPVYRSLIGTTNGVGGKSLVFGGTEEQKQRYLPPIARGDMIVSFCLTEADAGSDAASLRSSAVKVKGGYQLNGTKRFISNAPEAGLFVVMARTDASQPGAAGISAFLVEADQAGLSIGPNINKMGQKGAHTADVTFQDCLVPDGALLGGEEGTGFKIAMKVLDDGRIHMAAVATGLARRLIDEALAYAKERHQFGKPIAGFQLIQAMLADSETEHLAARSMVERTAARRDSGAPITKDASCCKYFATEALSRIADRAVQVHGGYGYVAEYAVERLYRDSRLLRIFEGTSQIQQLVIAREMIAGGN